MSQTQLENLHYEVVNRPLNFGIGDIVKVHYKIKEGDKERIQVYEGTVIAIKNSGAGKSFTVRRISFDVGVERIFPLYTPMIEKIEKVRSNKVRRSKLYYLRKKIGKAGRLKEIKKDDKGDKVYEKAIAYQKSLEDKATPKEADQEQTAESSSAE